MGIFDILKGISNGPRGGASASQSGGMSPISMGLLALLAYNAFKSGGPLGGIFGQGAPRTGGHQEPAPSGAGGGLMDWLRGSLGGAAAGGAAGSVISGGLGELVKRFQKNGFGDVADSWVKTGPNKLISASELEKAAGSDTLDALAREIGVPRQQLLENLSRELPDSVDTLTPEGRIPSDEQVSRWARAETERSL